MDASDPGAPGLDRGARQENAGAERTGFGIDPLRKCDALIGGSVPILNLNEAHP